jgi:hypothetical protein
MDDEEDNENDAKAKPGAKVTTPLPAPSQFMQRASRAEPAAAPQRFRLLGNRGESGVDETPCSVDGGADGDLRRPKSLADISDDLKRYFDTDFFASN